MDRIFKQQIRWNVDVYDMVVKSHSIAQHMADLEEVFGVLHKYDMHLNSEKCTFRVSGGKFLGSRSRTHWGIKANPKKSTVILESHSPTNVLEVQKLNGRLASLSRFLPKLTEKAKSFYKLLKKTEPFL